MSPPPRASLDGEQHTSRRKPQPKTREAAAIRHQPSHVVSAIAQSKNETRALKDMLAKVRAGVGAPMHTVMNTRCLVCVEHTHTYFHRDVAIIRRWKDAR